jgi:predicted alpha/beta-hydrolase family hydrolase
MSGYEEFVETSGTAPVRGFLHRAAGGGDSLILTHGAGANCQAPLLISLAEAFSASGVTVLRCDLPFRQQRPHGPPIRSAERDQAGLRAAVEAMRRLAGLEFPARIFLGGHSYGGRQASMLAAADPGLVDALLLLSYPLHPPKRPQQMRTQHFSELRTPALFVSGVRDGFGTIAELEAALELIPTRTELLPIQAAGHELITKRNREELPRAVVERFREFGGAGAGRLA